MIFCVDILGVDKFIVENDHNKAIMAARKILKNNKDLIKQINRQKIIKIFIFFQKFIISQESVYKSYLPQRLYWIEYVKHKMNMRTSKDIELDDQLVKKYLEINKNVLQYPRIATYIETAQKIFNELIYPDAAFSLNLYYSYYVEEVLIMWMNDYLETNFDLLVWCLPLDVKQL